jgi:23S rRNA (adenine2503-C2)-methyltransferase
MPSLSTVAPDGTDAFFDRLLELKHRKFADGKFQFQFSIHTTDESRRDEMIPVKKWSFERMADYGARFFREGDRKITLNFALTKDAPIDPAALRDAFDPGIFLIKITPINATHRAEKNNLSSYIDPMAAGNDYPVVEELRAAGYEVIVSIGEVEENFIGSNCGQYIQKHINASKPVKGAYTYGVEPVETESVTKK